MNNKIIKKVLMTISILNFISILSLLKMLQIVKKVDREEIISKQKSIERNDVYYKLVYEWFKKKTRMNLLLVFLINII